MKRTLRGLVPEGKITLGLAGGYTGETYEDYGDPRPQVGDELLLFGRAVDGGAKVLLVGGPQSFFYSVGGMAADAEKNPVIEPGCEGARLIARPVSQAPVGDAGLAPDGIPGVTRGDRIFVEEPALYGMLWADFVQAVANCVDRQPASEGATMPVGGAP